VVKDGRVLTPDRGSLHGITRKSVLELCAMMSIEAAIAPMPRALLEDADEVFLASTAGGVIPATRISRRILGNDRPGPITLALKRAYWQRHQEGWHRTPIRLFDDLPPKD
jgi:branched-chain amino acid aminotransferase